MQHSEDMNGENLAAVRRLLGGQEGEAEARQRLQQALTEVREERNFLPTIAVRRVVKRAEFLHLTDGEQLRLLDWTTLAAVDWLEDVAANPQHPGRERLGSVAPNFYQSLALVLREWREGDPDQELLWRLMQLAGWDLEALSPLLDEELEELNISWVAAQAAFATALKEQRWGLDMLDKAQIRPLLAVTRVLEWIELEDRQLWDVSRSPEVWARMTGQARRLIPSAAESLVQESLLRMRNSREIPANSRELSALTAKIIYRLALDRFEMQGWLQHIGEAGVLERLQEPVSKAASRNASKQEDLAEAWMLTTRNLLRDQSGLHAVLECWVEGLGVAETAERLGVNPAMVKRNRREIRDYFKDQFARLEIDSAEFVEFSLDQRRENLYQNLEKEMRQRTTLPAGEQRELMDAALEAMERDDEQRSQWLEEAYLGPELSPTELGKRWALPSTESVNERKRELKAALIDRMVAIHRAKGRGA